MKCPICNGEVKEMYSITSEREDFKCFGCHISELYRRIKKLEDNLK